MNFLNLQMNEKTDVAQKQRLSFFYWLTQPFILLFILGEHPQKVAVVQIQSPEAGGLFAAFPVSGHTVSFGFRDRLR